MPLFIETPTFTNRWGDLDLTDSDLARLQWLLVLSPISGKVVSGTGGFRKVRFVPPSMSGKGKSGGLRVLYLTLPTLRSIVLGLAFAKNEISNVNAAGKKALAKIAVEFETLLPEYLIRRKG